MFPLPPPKLAAVIPQTGQGIWLNKSVPRAEMFCNTDDQPFQFAVSRLRNQNHLGTGSSIPRQELLNPPLILTQSIPTNLFSKTSKGATSRFIPVSCEY